MARGNVIEIVISGKDDFTKVGNKTGGVLGSIRKRADSLKIYSENQNATSNPMLLL